MAALFDDLLLAWPDQLPAAPACQGEPLWQAARAIRLHQHPHAQALLLAALPDPGQTTLALALLAHHKLVRESLDQGLFALVHALQERDRDLAYSRYLQVQLWLIQGDGAALEALPDAFWHASDDGGRLLQLARVAFWVRNGEHARAQQQLQHSGLGATLEGCRLQARIAVAQRRLADAIALLEPAARRAPMNLALQQQYVQLLLEARDSHRPLPALRLATSHHGDHPRLLRAITAIKLLQRQPGMGRRAALIERASATVRPTELNLSNLLIGYEHCGHADWMPHVLPQVRMEPATNFDLGSNLILQLASCESPRLTQQCQHFVDSLQRLPAFQQAAAAAGPIQPLRASAEPPLRIAWFSPDLTHHPVGRFVHGFFAAAAGRLQHQHQLVSLQDHGDHSWLDRFAQLPGVELVDLSATPLEQRLAPARALQADIAIDLAGWTANHFAPGFLARLAPLQINYLGYFASTGLPSMDVWLGDDALFPEPMHEWHSERIHRLGRCFLAWQPSSALPECGASVDDAAPGPVRFGSFNHTRKLSDATLRVWGTLLAALPEAQLVLKANAQDDAATQELLRRRLHRAGITPERIVWLPFAATPIEHLQQYRHIDIALDPFPNGGCTTTCEALWMGVPTIALAGRHYVSRMSTAVLAGAQLQEWVCTTPQDYVDKAVAMAAQVGDLRCNRERWRRQLQASPLGDATALMSHLEQAFTSLYAEQISRAAAAG